MLHEPNVYRRLVQKFRNDMQHKIRSRPRSLVPITDETPMITFVYQPTAPC